MSCSVSSLSKYTSRPSPPRPANSAGCRGQIHVGNDGKDWISKATVNGVYRWVKVGGGSPPSTKRKSTRRKSTRRKSTRRKSTRRKSTRRKSTKRKSTKRKSTKRK